MSEQDKAQLKEILEAARQQILAANTHFKIWKSLTGEGGIVEGAVNAYKGFFIPVIDANAIAFLIKASITTAWI